MWVFDMNVPNQDFNYEVEQISELIFSSFYAEDEESAIMNIAKASNNSGYYVFRSFSFLKDRNNFPKICNVFENVIFNTLKYLNSSEVNKQYFKNKVIFCLEELKEFNMNEYLATGVFSCKDFTCYTAPFILLYTIFLVYSYKCAPYLDYRYKAACIERPTVYKLDAYRAIISYSKRREFGPILECFLDVTLEKDDFIIDFDIFKFTDECLQELANKKKVYKFFFNCLIENNNTFDFVEEFKNIVHRNLLYYTEGY